MERVRTSELKTGNKTARNIMERSTVMKFLLKLVGVLGVSLIMSGMLFYSSIKGGWTGMLMVI